MTVQHSATVRNAMGDTITTALGNASLLRVYSGTIPADVAASITGTLLAELVGGTPYAGASSSGTITANAITSDSSADATGTASHYRQLTSGATAHAQGTVGTSGADLNFNTTSFVATGSVAVSSLTYTMPGA